MPNADKGEKVNGYLVRSGPDTTWKAKKTEPSEGRSQALCCGRYAMYAVAREGCCDGGRRAPVFSALGDEVLKVKLSKFLGTVCFFSFGRYWFSLAFVFIGVPLLFVLMFSNYYNRNFADSSIK